LILDAPSTAHIPSLVKGFESGAFSKYWGKGPEKKDHVLRVVFHLCGNDVFEHEQYKAFMKGFEDDVHVSAPCSVCALGCSDAIESSISLHLEIMCQIRSHLLAQHSTS
jgi:hypothetical protein